MAKDLRSAAAQHIVDALGARYDIVYHNLGYASPGLIQWASSANAASLRATAAMPPDRLVYDQETERYVNPLWYHGSIGADRG